MDNINRNPTLIADPQSIGDVFNALDPHPLIAFDTETTGLNRQQDTIYGCSLAVIDQEWFVTGPALPAFLPGLHELMGRKDKHWLAWNSPFDMSFIGAQPYNLIDVQVAAWMADENQSMKLKDQARLRMFILEDLPEFNDLRKAIKSERKLKRMDQVHISDIPMEMMLPYACRDARLTFDLWVVLEDILMKEALHERFFKTEMPFMKLLQNMEDVGVLIDQARLDEIAKEFQAEYDDLLQKWMALTGGINPNSHQQLAHYYFTERGFKPTSFTEKGQPQVDSLALKRIKAKDKTGSVDILLQMKGFTKLINTYIDGIQDGIYEGRLNTNFNRTRTVTGRLSSSEPNLQNIPVRTKRGKMIRSVFISPPGMVLIVTDYSAFELRIMAHYSKDKYLIEVFNEGKDPHNLTAERVGLERFMAKTLNYMKPYGASPGGVCDRVEEETGTRPKYSDVKKWLNDWDNAYPGVPRWMNRVVNWAERLGYVQTIGGRKRRLPEISSRIESLRSAAARQACNAPIQGSAADLIEDAMLSIDPYLPWYDARMLLQIHDEIVVECPIEAAPDLAPIIKREMEAVGEIYNLHVPIIAEPGIGTNWADAKG